MSSLKKFVGSPILFVFLSLVFGIGFANAQVKAPSRYDARLDRIQKLIEADIAEKKLPGAVVLIGNKGRMVYKRAFGNRAVAPVTEKMTVDTVFDMASVTKVVATSTSMMILIERGDVRLADTLAKFFPEIKDEQVKRITVQQLLTHTTGYAPDFDLKEKWHGRDGMLDALSREKLRTAPGVKFVYSDIGFIVLGDIVARVSGKSLDKFFADEVAAPLGMRDSGFHILDDEGRYAGPLVARTAPTENIRGQMSYLGSQFDGDPAKGGVILRGQVHDPTAFRMHGVAGHAGLFSTADDLARYCQMILDGGTADGRQILSSSTVARMTAPIVISEDGWTRGLGWDIATSYSSNRGELFPLGSFGHTGFTGTSIWIDPVSETYVVFLSNRVHPDGKGDVGALRSKVMTVIASVYGGKSGDRFREFEAQYAAQVAAQVPRFKEAVESAKRSAAAETRPADAQVLNGIDVLERTGFKQLEGLRIGLVTNHTGRNLGGKATIDVLKEAKNVNLVALFSPEHGIRGELDQAKINDSVDEKTGLPIYSLYGDTRRPKPEQLKDLDAVVFDIQDIGTRFYTYISTLQNVMEEAAKAGKPVFVLDRVNPINGIDVEGPLADEDKLSFVATHTIPVRHGMTIGELAMMFNKERAINSDLRVVKMENWSRGFWFDQVSQTWVNPSPNMRSLTEATLYPGVGMLEYTNLSVGRGTDTPFEVIGAPWIDGQKLAKLLNGRGLPGVRFVPVKFKPNASVFKGEDCGGINIMVTDRRAFRSVRTGVEIAVALRRLFPNEWKSDRYLGLIVNRESFDRVVRSDDPAEIESGWKAQIDAFSRRRAQYLLYKP